MTAASDPKTRTEQGLAALRQRDWEAAEAAFAELVALAPRASASHHYLGITRASKGDAAGAVEPLEQALALSGPAGESGPDLALVLGDLGRWAEAEALLAECIRHRPGDRRLRIEHAVSQARGGDLEATARSLEEAGLPISGAPHEARTWLDAARGLADAGAVDLSLGLLAAVAETIAHPASVYEDLAVYRARTGDSAGAAKARERAWKAEATPERAYRWHLAHRAAAQEDAAEAALETGRARFPEDARLALRTALWLPDTYRSVAHLEAARSRFFERFASIRVRASEEGANWLDAFDGRHNFALPYQGREDRRFFEDYGRLHTELARAHHPLPTARSRSGRSRPRIGFVSSHLHSHSVTRLVEGWFRHLDRRRLEIRVFHAGTAVDAFTHRLKKLVEGFEILPTSLDAACRQLLSVELDVLVHLDIGMSARSQALAARRLAPVQATTMAHPVTSGYPNIDIYLSAEAFEPSDAEAHYSEHLMPLPGVGFSMVRPERGAGITRDALGLPEGAPLFLCAQSLFKLSPAHDEVFVRILSESPDSHLALLEGRAPAHARRFLARLDAAADRCGLPRPGPRVHVLPKLDADTFRGLHAAVDINLDAFPWSSCTSILDGWSAAPVPTVAWEGPWLRARTASGLLRLAGVDTLVAETLDDYVDLATRLAWEPDFRCEQRAQLEAGTPSLFEDRRPVRALEEILSTLSRVG